MKYWFIPIDNKAFNIEEKFNNPPLNEVAFLDMHQLPNCKFIAGDIACIYCTKEQAIKYKCLISKINIPIDKTYDDSKFVNDPEYFGGKRKYENYMRLLLISKINVGLKEIQTTGFEGFNIQREIPKELLEILNNEL